MSAIFLLAVCWPTDLDSVSRDAHLAMKVSTKFEVDTTIRCLVIALLLLIRYVTLWPWPLTFWPWSVVIHGGSCVLSLHQVWRSYGYPFSSHELWISYRIPLTMRLQPLRMRRITWPRSIFEIPDPDLPIHYTILWRYDAGLKPAACGSLRTQDAKMSPKIAIWAPSHNFVGLYIFAIKARIDNRKKTC